MDQLGVETVDEVRLAGAFGSQIDPLHALVLGLVPDCDLATRAARPATPPGPARSSRCCRAAARREIEGVVRRVEKIETAVEPRFQEHFVEAMAFPHATAAFPHLARGRDAASPRARADRPARTAGAERRRRRAVAVGTQEAE